MTKVIGTTSVYMKLVEEGKIDVNELLSKYLPEFIDAAPTSKDKSMWQIITIENLLTHAAGFLPHLV